MLYRLPHGLNQKKCNVAAAEKNDMHIKTPNLTKKRDISGTYNNRIWEAVNWFAWQFSPAYLSYIDIGLLYYLALMKQSYNKHTEASKTPISHLLTHLNVPAYLLEAF
ncbi:hypothetical protein BD408DRAFT_61247 [Parasitella parasitica]|nr:hypothetical protein BD408DRAFT_61247 [Parasitella parasitica]